jgi:hypothetical protein
MLDLRTLNQLRSVRLVDLNGIFINPPPLLTEVETTFSSQGPLHLDLVSLSLRRLVIKAKRLDAGSAILREFICKMPKGSLEELVVDPANAITDQFLVGEMFTPQLESLRTLELAESPMNDDTLQYLAARCPTLTKLRLPRSRNVTGAGIKQMLRKDGEKLKELDLRQAKGVAGDAIAWARSMGVIVKTQAEESGKQRARYGYGYGY